MSTRRHSIFFLGAFAVLLQAWGLGAALASDRPDTSVEAQLRFAEGDERGNDVKALKTEMLVIRSEKRALQQLEKLVKKHKGTRLEPEMLFRLAELYMRRARSERFFEVHKNSEDILSLAPQLVREANEVREIKKAIEIYAHIRTAFPGFRSMDIVNFNEAYARQQVGDERGAEHLYLVIVEKFIDSQVLPDSWLALGEISYQRRQFQVALERFEAVRKFPQARAYPYGLYKAAWCRYNLQDAKQAMAQLEEVVAFGRQTAEEARDMKLDLRSEALADLALFFGDVYPSSKAVEYFTVQAVGLDASPFLLKLNELYKRHGRFSDVEVLLKSYIAKLPNASHLVIAHDELLWNYEKAKQRPQAVQFLKAFAKFCDAKKQAESCRDKISESAQKLGAKWHATWKDRNPTPELAQSAEAAYLVYLRYAKVSSAEYGQTRFGLAELLFQQQKYREASQQYEQVVLSNVDQKTSHSASYGALLSLEKANKNTWNDADEKKFRELADLYLGRYPQGEHKLEIQFKKAFIAYEKERYDEAAPEFKLIGWSKAEVPAIQVERVNKAQDLYLDILNIKKDYKTLRESALTLIRPGLLAERRATVEKIYREAYYLEVQAKEEKGDFIGAVAGYKKFALENTASELAQKAWWNASQIEFRMGEAEAGAKTCYQMHKLFPNAANAKDCLMRAAQTFEAMGRLELAARVLLSLAQLEDDKKEKWQELAADFFALSGGRERATQMYQKLAEGRKPDEAVRFFGKIEVLAKVAGDQAAYAEIHRKIASLGLEPMMSESVVEEAERQLSLGQSTEAFNTAKRVVGRETLPKSLLARARLVQALVLDEEFKRQSTKTRVERLALVLQIKTEKLEKAQKAYQATIKYGDGDTSIRALRGLASCYSHYAEAVRAMQLPAESSAEERAQFTKEMESLAVPMEEKGIESIAQAFEAAKKFGLRDGRVAELQDELDKLNLKPELKARPVVVVPAVALPEFPLSTAQGGAR